MNKDIKKNATVNKFGRKNIREVDETERIIHDGTDFNTLESYKSIRTNIMFSMPKTEKGKIIVLTSSEPGEGKTVTSINLAITFAQTGAKVILVDCDLRKSRVHRYLKIERGDGITNVLCGFSDLKNAINRGVRPNLDVLTAGAIPPNPAELLESEEFTKMLEFLKEDYDYIIVDTPPITFVTDAAVVLRRATGVVVVVRQDVTTYDVLDMTMEGISKTGVKVLGVIVVGCTDSSRKYGYYKGRYGGKYGYKGYNSAVYGYGDKPSTNTQNKAK